MKGANRDMRGEEDATCRISVSGSYLPHRRAAGAALNPQRGVMNATAVLEPAADRSVAIRRPGCTAAAARPEVAQPRRERIEVGDHHDQAPEARALAVGDRARELEKGRAEHVERLAYLLPGTSRTRRGSSPRPTARPSCGRGRR